MELDVGKGQKTGLISLNEIKYFLARFEGRDLEEGDKITVYVEHVDQDGRVKLSFRPVGKSKRNEIIWEVGHHASLSSFVFPILAFLYKLHFAPKDLIFHLSLI